MYEPVILQKRKPRSIAGTPTSVLCVIGAVAFVAIPTIGLSFLCNFMYKKRKLIAEFDERDVNYREKTMFEEYQETRSFWQNTDLQGAVSLAFQNLREKNKFNKPVESSNSDSDIPKANN